MGFHLCRVILLLYEDLGRHFDTVQIGMTAWAWWTGKLTQKYSHTQYSSAQQGNFLSPPLQGTSHVLGCLILCYMLRRLCLLDNDKNNFYQYTLTSEKF